MPVCPECGREMPDGSRFCDKCGHEFTIAISDMDMVFRTDLLNNSRYMKFFAYYFIISGAFSCIGIITALIGVPMIFAGIRVRESAEAYKRLSLTGSFSDLSQAIAKQTRGLYIMFLLTIIGLIVYVIYLFVLLIFLAFR
jgi:hypothetical protein